MPPCVQMPGGRGRGRGGGGRGKDGGGHGGQGGQGGRGGQGQKQGGQGPGGGNKASQRTRGESERSEGDEDRCLVCLNKMEVGMHRICGRKYNLTLFYKVYSVGECNHPICYICSTRMRVSLYF